MVKFEEITQKIIKVNYTKDDVPGYVVKGTAMYSMDKLSDVNGDIRNAEGKQIANFNTFGKDESTRINLTDCLAGMMSEAVVAAEATLADLAKGYPVQSNPEV